MIGTLLMALLTVTMTLALSDFVSESLPEATQAQADRWDLGATLKPGPGQWGDGDEEVVLVHRGGSRLLSGETRIMVDVQGDVSEHTGGSLGGGFGDGSLTIGERWTSTTTVPAGASVSLHVVVTEPKPRVVAEAQLSAGSKDCSNDTAAPTVEAFTQDPADVDSGHVGEITITATLEDACAGVNGDTTPHLKYRVGNGSSLQDAGGMTQVSTASWQLGIPEPQDGWGAHENATIHYYLDPIADLSGNQDTSQTRTDRLQPGEPTPGTLTYATEHVAFSGTVENASNMGSAENGHATNLTENATGTGPVTSESYGTAHSSSGADAPGNATGAPDDAHTVLPTDRDWIGVTGFNTFQGAVDAVEIAFEGHADGTTNGDEDELSLTYEVSGSEGPTTAAYNVTELGQGTDGAPRYVNVTSDRSWTWTDVSNLLVKATYTKKQSEDAVDLHVDALWTRVTYEDPAWNLSVQVNITGIPTGDQHEVEIQYNTTGEIFNVDVWNATESAWHAQGSTLSSTSHDNTSFLLEPAEIDGDTVQLRFRDDGPDATLKDTLALDHVRVRTR